MSSKSIVPKVLGTSKYKIKRSPSLENLNVLLKEKEKIVKSEDKFQFFSIVIQNDDENSPKVGSPKSGDLMNFKEYFSTIKDKSPKKN